MANLFGKRGVDLVDAALAKYGIKNLEEAKAICEAKGIDPYKMCEETQPICFENAKWAYVCLLYPSTRKCNPVERGAARQDQGRLGRSGYRLYLRRADRIQVHGKPCLLYTSYPLDGFRADAILFVLAVQHPRNSRNRNSSASGNTFQVILWTHSRIKFYRR